VLAGRGVTVRHPSLRTSAGTLTGSETAGPRTAIEIEAAKIGGDWLDASRSEEAQQLSACACVTMRSEPVASDWCIGHEPFSAQHAIRASGVAAQPAHTARFPAKRARISAPADSRRLKTTTPVGCLTAVPVSNTDSEGAAYNRSVRRLLATVVLVVFASLNAMDGVCCPDGCTQEQQSPAQQHTPQSTGGICVLCLGGVDSAVPQELSPFGTVTDRIGLPRIAHHLDAPSDPLEHPPRS
jgi:hypothetical protein